MADFENVQPDEYKLLGMNFTPGRPWGIKYITIHHMAGDLDADQCNSVWRKAGTSAHYSVDRGGKIVQHVNDTDRAYACGDGVGVQSGGNDCSISIEHANSGSNPWTVHDAAIESGAHLVAALCKYYKLGRPQWGVNVFPHKHWKATACPGELAGSQNAKYMQRAQEWYDAMCGGKPAPAPTPAPAPQPQPAPQPTPSRKPLGKVDVRYALRNLNGGWNSEIVDFGDGPEGFAGVPNGQHDLLYVKVDKGSVKYRAHIVGGGWLDWVTKGDPADTVHGCAGVPGRAIDGVQVYYTTPDGFEYQQAWYRSQTKCRAGWLPVCCDDGGSVKGHDGWAGVLGEPLDRLQIAICDRNPF